MHIDGSGNAINCGPQTNRMTCMYYQCSQIYPTYTKLNLFSLRHELLIFRFINIAQTIMAMMPLLLINKFSFKQIFHYAHKETTPSNNFAHVLDSSSHNKLFRPFHIFGSKPLAATCQFHTYVRFLQNRGKTTNQLRNIYVCTADLHVTS